MNDKPKKEFRKRRLFPRTLDEVIKHATKPMMDKQGKLYSALLRDWSQIVGEAHAAVTRPERLHFPRADAEGATLHLTVRPAAAPELAYAQEQLIEQCARYFGYRAITRIVLHATHGVFDAGTNPIHPPLHQAPAATPSLPANLTPEMHDVLTRIGTHVGSTVAKKDEAR